MSTQASDNIDCPICGRSFPRELITDHVNLCLDNQASVEEVRPSATENQNSLILSTSSDLSQLRNFLNEDVVSVPTPPPLPNTTIKKQKKFKEQKRLSHCLSLANSTQNFGTSKDSLSPPIDVDNLIDIQVPSHVPSPPIEEYIINSSIDDTDDNKLNDLDFNHLMNITKSCISTKAYQNDIVIKNDFKKQYPIIELPIDFGRNSSKNDGNSVVVSQQNTNENNVSLQRHFPDIKSLFEEIYEKDEFFFDVVISFKNNEDSQPNIIKAHSFVLASRSPLFYVELKEMKRVEGVYFYEVENYSYKDFEMFIRALYSIEPVEKMNTTKELREIISTYSITKGDIMNSIINLQQEVFFDGFFCITKNEEEVERLGFSKLLFYLRSDYFFTLFQKINTQSRDVTLFPDLGIPKEKYTPKSDTTPFIFKIKGDNEKMGFIKTAIQEFIQFIYKQWKYSLDVSSWNEVSSQKVLPILLHFSYIFKEPTLSVICERLLGQNLIITPKNSNALFLSMNMSSDRFKYYLVTNLLDSMKEYSDFNVIREWKKEIVEIIYNITQNLTGYDVVKQITASTGGVEHPLHINCLSINDIQQISRVALISFLNTTSEQSEIVRECCIRKFHNLLSRSDVINYLIIKGLRELLPILLACVGGTSFDSPISKQLNDIMNSLLITICNSYSTLSPLRGFIPLTDNLINNVNRLIESSCLFILDYIF
ncbi:BTB domain-containing protein [Entamoeba marina]